MKQKIWLGCLAFASGLLGVMPAMADENAVNLYSARHYESDKALYEAFTEKTGIRVNVVSGKAPELIERIRREGENTPADVFITVDGGVLNTAKKAGILQAMPAGAFSKEVPHNLRDREGYWVGLTTRARVIVYSRERVKPEELSSYEDLVGAKWKGRVLVRSSAGLYDQSLLASLIAIDGYEAAEKWAAGIVANMARQPRGNDRAQAKAIAAGEGDVAIMNTCYIGQMLHSKDPEEVRVAKNTGVFFPNQKTTGTHINISGAGLTKYGKNRENAMKLIGYLLSVPVQEALSNGNYEYPVNPKAKKHKLLDTWGPFRPQQIDFSLLGENNPNAIRIFNKVGWK